MCLSSGAAAVTVIDFTASGPYSITKSSSQVTTTLQPGIGTDVTIAPGTDAYPSVTIEKDGTQSYPALLTYPIGGIKEGITYTTEVSSDLIHWYSDPANQTILDQSPAGFEVRDSNPLGSSAKSYLRLKVTVP